jgi:hypothetical protein
LASRPQALDGAPDSLQARLRARRLELEQAALARIGAISDPSEVADPEYLTGLRTALSAALDYGFAATRDSEERPPQIPVVLLGQARMAARNGVGLDTVLRRYCAGYALLNDLLVSEAERSGAPQLGELKPLLRALALRFDRLLVAISEEYSREAASCAETSGRRHLERVQKLLAGELVDLAELAYDFDGFHIGAIASGHDAAESLRRLADSLDCRLLLVQPDEQSAWGWIGARRQLDPAELADQERARSQQSAIALGEPGRGLAGWRLTHRQAAAALPIAQRGEARCVRYLEVALLASALQDELLATSLRQLYLAPLEAERDSGEVARATLRAYFAAERSISSAAAALGVNRHTVAARLRAIEARLDCTLERRAADIEAALRLEELGDPAAIQLGLVSRLTPS